MKKDMEIEKLSPPPIVRRMKKDMEIEKLSPPPIVRRMKKDMEIEKLNPQADEERHGNRKTESPGG